MAEQKQKSATSRPRSPRRTIWEAAQRVCLGEVLSKSEFTARHDAVEARIHDLWYDSKETDFSFYSEPEYVYPLFGSWDVRSAMDVDYLIKHDLFVSNPRSFFDFHGGMGLTCMRLAMAFPDAVCWSHSVVPQHRDWCTAIAAELGLANVRSTAGVHPADVLVAQETLEHIKRPFEELEYLLNEVNPIQYLDGTSFTLISPGHFSVFFDGEEEVPKQRARARLTRMLRDRGFVAYWKAREGQKHPYNGRPALYDGPVSMLKH